jgi:hypothetical protein
MTYRSLHGLTFKIWSPSHWELCARDDASFIALAAIHFDGSYWNIHVLMKKGHTITRGPFPTLASAVQVIAFGAAKEQTNVS